MIRVWPRPALRTGATWVTLRGSGADADPGEPGDLTAGVGHELADGLLRILGEGLVQEHAVLEETVQAALDDLRDGLLGLAFVDRGLLGDAPLVGHLILGHLLTVEEIGRASCRERVSGA